VNAGGVGHLLGPRLRLFHCVRAGGGPKRAVVIDGETELSHPDGVAGRLSDRVDEWTRDQVGCAGDRPGSLRDDGSPSRYGSGRRNGRSRNPDRQRGGGSLAGATEAEPGRWCFGSASNSRRQPAPRRSGPPCSPCRPCWRVPGIDVDGMPVAPVRSMKMILTEGDVVRGTECSLPTDRRPGMSTRYLRVGNRLDGRRRS